MSEEVAQAIGDIAYWRQRAEQAEQRERIINDTYNGQQQSYRELEALYQAAQERAIDAQATVNGILSVWEGRTRRDQLVWFAGKILEAHDDLVSTVTDLESRMRRVEADAVALETIVNTAQSLRIAMRDVETAQSNIQAANAKVQADLYWRSLRSLLEQAAVKGGQQ